MSRRKYKYLVLAPCKLRGKSYDVNDIIRPEDNGYEDAYGLVRRKKAKILTDADLEARLAAAEEDPLTPAEVTPPVTPPPADNTPKTGNPVIPPQNTAGKTVNPPVTGQKVVTTAAAGKKA